MAKEIQIRLFQSDECISVARPRKWTDPRIVNEVDLIVPIGGWFALSVPTGFGLASSLAACSFTASVSVPVDGRWQLLSTKMQSLGLSRPRYGSRASPGKFDTDLSVIVEKFSHGQIDDIDGATYMNFQVLVRNNSPDLRIVGIRDRTLSCKAGEMQWTWGQNEAISGLGSGPIELPANAWTVFSQRGIGKQGNDCIATFEIVELRAATALEQLHWATVVKVTSKGRPVVQAQY